MNNFQSTTAILSSLNGYPILRLKQSWSQVPETSLEVFRHLEEVMNPTYSYKNYRQALYAVEPPCVPFLAITFMDLDFLEGSSRRESYKNMIGFSRHHRIYEVISMALMYQNPSYNIQIHPIIKNPEATLMRSGEIT